MPLESTEKLLPHHLDALQQGRRAPVRVLPGRVHCTVEVVDDVEKGGEDASFLPFDVL